MVGAKNLLPVNGSIIIGPYNGRMQYVPTCLLVIIHTTINILKNLDLKSENDFTVF